MRVLFLTPSLAWPPDHGGRIRTSQLLGALAETHDVVNVTGLSGADDPAHVAELESLGLRVRHAPLVPTFGRRPLPQRLAKLARLAAGRSSLLPRFRSAELARLVAEEARSADLVVLEQVWMAAYRREIGRVPFVLSTQNVESDVLARKAELATGQERALARREGRGLRRVEAATIRASRTTVCVSDPDARRLTALAGGAARIVVIENGVDATATRPLPAAEPSPPRLLYLGGYDYHPNQDAAERLVREVLPEVRATLPDAEVWLVGADPDGVLAPLGEIPGVRLLGRVADVIDAWRPTTALVAPLAYGGGSRLKILEAFALGRPVVTTPEGADGLDVRDGEHLLIRQDAPAIADAFCGLVCDDEQRARLIEAARHHVEAHHDWSGLRAQFRAVIDGAS